MHTVPKRRGAAEGSTSGGAKNASNQAEAGPFCTEIPLPTPPPPTAKSPFPVALGENQATVNVFLLTTKALREDTPLPLPGKYRRCIGNVFTIYCCSVIQSCPTLRDPMDQSTPGPSVFHCLPELGRIHVGRFDDPAQPHNL